MNIEAFDISIAAAMNASYSQIAPPHAALPYVLHTHSQDAGIETLASVHDHPVPTHQQCYAQPLGLLGEHHKLVHQMLENISTESNSAKYEKIDGVDRAPMDTVHQTQYPVPLEPAVVREPHSSSSHDNIRTSRAVADSTETKKRKSYTIEFKRDALRVYDEVKSIGNAVTLLGLPLKGGKKMLRDWIKNKDKIMSMYHKNIWSGEADPRVNRKLHPGKRPVLTKEQELKVCEWYQIQQKAGREISNSDISAKAREVSGQDDFKGTTRWLMRFKRINGLASSATDPYKKRPRMQDPDDLSVCLGIYDSQMEDIQDDHNTSHMNTQRPAHWAPDNSAHTSYPFSHPRLDQRVHHVSVCHPSGLQCEDRNHREHVCFLHRDVPGSSCSGNRIHIDACHGCVTLQDLHLQHIDNVNMHTHEMTHPLSATPGGFMRQLENQDQVQTDHVPYGEHFSCLQVHRYEREGHEDKRGSALVSTSHEDDQSIDINIEFNDPTDDD